MFKRLNRKINYHPDDIRLGCTCERNALREIMRLKEDGRSVDQEGQGSTAEGRPRVAEANGGRNLLRYSRRSREDDRYMRIFSNRRQFYFALDGYECRR